MIVNSFCLFLSHPMTHALFWSFQYLPFPHVIQQNQGLQHLLPLREYPDEWRRAYLGLDDITTLHHTNTYRTMALARLYPDDYTDLLIQHLTLLQQSQPQLIYSFYNYLTCYDVILQRLEPTSTLFPSFMIWLLEKDSQYYTSCEELNIFEDLPIAIPMIECLIQRGDTHPYLQQWCDIMSAQLPPEWYKEHPLWRDEYPNVSDVQTAWHWILHQEHFVEESEIIV